MMEERRMRFFFIKVFHRFRVGLWPRMVTHKRQEGLSTTISSM
jgi:hypothetical protein